jgi:site-specific DNA recombinase
MISAVSYTRVSSKEQEAEGFSIPAQQKLVVDYARKNDLQIRHAFEEIETAKKTGRKQFGLMLKYLLDNPSCRAVIVEKTDRLYRNFADAVTLDKLGVEIHLAKEGRIIGKNSRSQDRLLHGIQLVIAANFIDNLKEEVRKGMREKAEQGIYPSRPPLGYLNNKAERTIEVDPVKAPLARRMFELYGAGTHSLTQVRLKIKTEFGVSLAKGYLQRLLKSPFYTGIFVWDGKTYSGSHTPLITDRQFQNVQQTFQGRNKPKYRKHEFAFRGLLTCAYDKCLVTAEIKKSKYTYYRCTGYRGKCDLPYFREEELGNRLGQIVKDIHIPDHVLRQLVDSLLNDKDRGASVRKEQRDRLEQRLTSVRNRLDQAYVDKLDGKIPEDLWLRKSAEWQSEEREIQMSIQALADVRPERMLDAVKILELANKAHYLYVSQTPVEQAKLLNLVLSNCAIDAVSVYPTYRKPFDLIFDQGKNEGWCARRDSNSRPSGSKPDALSS